MHDLSHTPAFCLNLCVNIDPELTSHIEILSQKDKNEEKTSMEVEMSNGVHVCRSIHSVGGGGGE